tara:strand:+ start:70 stop:456 length:387 start_codon:yes stop_codon:yes gene_type:complete
MASVLKVDNIGKTSGSTQDTMAGLAKAWANYTGITNTTSRDTFNVSSLTDNATGKTTVTLSNNMNNDDYSGFYYNSGTASTGYENFDNHFTGGFGTFNTSNFSQASYGGTAGYRDVTRNFTGILGDLA